MTNSLKENTIFTKVPYIDKPIDNSFLSDILGILNEKIEYTRIGNNLYIETKEDSLDGISIDEFKTFLLKLADNFNRNGNEISTVHFSSKLKAYITQIVGKNHPLYELTRIKEGSDLINIIFSGVKDLNKIGKELVDDFTETLKRKINKNIKTGIPEDIKKKVLEKRGESNNNEVFFRIIRSDYKNHTLSIHEGIEDTIKLLFSDERDKKKLIGEIFDETFSSISEENFRIKLLGTEEAEEFKKLKDLNFSELKSLIKEKFITEFKFGFAQIEVDKLREDETVTEKGIKRIDILRRVELAGRSELEKDTIKQMPSYNQEEMNKKKEKALETFDEIVKRFKPQNNNTFFYKIKGNDTLFSIVIKTIPKGGYKINDLLLQHIKNGGNIENIVTKTKEGKIKKITNTYSDEINPLKKLDTNYIKQYNQIYDYIPPLKEKSDILEIEEAEKQIKGNSIDFKKLTHNYKGTLIKEALEVDIEGKQGMGIFIDIARMGIMNIQDYQNIANEGRRIKEEIKEKTDNNIELHKLQEELKQFEEEEKLLPGYEVSKKFFNFIDSVKINYPEVKISLGGDEVMIFIEGRTDEKGENEILSKISLLLQLDDVELEGRISETSLTGKEERGKKSFSKQDSSTEINRGLEEIINNICSGDKDINKPGPTILKYSDFIEDLNNSGEGEANIKSFSLKFREACNKNEIKIFLLLKENNENDSMKFKIDKKEVILERFDFFIKITII